MLNAARQERLHLNAPAHLSPVMRRTRIVEALDHDLELDFCSRLDAFVVEWKNDVDVVWETSSARHAFGSVSDLPSICSRKPTMSLVSSHIMSEVVEFDVCGRPA